MLQAVFVLIIFAFLFVSMSQPAHKTARYVASSLCVISYSAAGYLAPHPEAHLPEFIAVLGGVLVGPFLCFWRVARCIVSVFFFLLISSVDLAVIVCFVLLWLRGGARCVGSTFFLPSFFASLYCFCRCCNAFFTCPLYCYTCLRCRLSSLFPHSLPSYFAVLYVFLLFLFIVFLFRFIGLLLCFV